MAVFENEEQLDIPRDRSSADDEVGGQADVGRGKLALVPNDRPFTPLAHMACRDTRSS